MLHNTCKHCRFHNAINTLFRRFQYQVSDAILILLQELLCCYKNLLGFIPSGCSSAVSLYESERVNTEEMLHSGKSVVYTTWFWMPSVVYSEDGTGTSMKTKIFIVTELMHYMQLLVILSIAVSCIQHQRFKIYLPTPSNKVKFTVFLGNLLCQRHFPHTHEYIDHLHPCWLFFVTPCQQYLSLAFLNVPVVLFYGLQLCKGNPQTQSKTVPVSHILQLTNQIFQACYSVNVKVNKKLYTHDHE